MLLDGGDKVLLLYCCVMPPSPESVCGGDLKIESSSGPSPATEGDKK